MTTPAHPFLAPVGQSAAEAMSDAKPPSQAVMAMTDGTMSHVSGVGVSPISHPQPAPWLHANAGATSGLARTPEAAGDINDPPQGV